MTQKRTPRQQVIINRPLRIRFAEKCLKNRVIDTATNVQSSMEILMRTFINGGFDDALPKERLPKEPKTKDDPRVQLNSKLKKDFSFRAWEKTDLINDPRYGVRVLEMLMQMYLDGKIKIERDE